MIMTLLTISLDYDGEDSTDDQEELATALRGIARRLDNYDWIMGNRYGVRDVNGSIIGYWETAPSPGYPQYVVTSELGERTWTADDEDHAREQHENAFPDEHITGIQPG